MRQPNKLYKHLRTLISLRLPGLRPGWTALIVLGCFLMVVLGPMSIHAQTAKDTLSPVSGHPVSPTGILPSDVLARTELLGKTLEQIRVEMGKPKDEWVGGIASKASPHEVYFQALNLFLKANRLSLEMAGSMGIQPEIRSASDIQPFHIWKIVNEAYKRILVVKQELGIPGSTSEQLKDPSTTMTHAGGAIVAANRQINLVLERPFTPGDVVHQVNLAIQYAAKLLQQFPKTTPIPQAPPFERGKQPGEAFLRLVDCFERLEAIAQQSKVPVLHFDRNAMNKAVNHYDFHPSDVYDMATLLVSDLAFLHAKLNSPQSPTPVSYPTGRIFPSHAYQQAGVLYAQLVQLEQHVKNHPDWLNH